MQSKQFKLLPTRGFARYAKQLPFSVSQEQLEESVKDLDYQINEPVFGSGRGVGSDGNAFRTTAYNSCMSLLTSRTPSKESVFKNADVFFDKVFYLRFRR